MDIRYAATPFITWFIAGALKFVINSVRLKSPAFRELGYGGMPSNHSAIVASTAALTALSQGVSSPAFGIAVTLAFIVILDAHSLRRVVGTQAKAINALSGADATPRLRERMGHTPLEIASGIVVGFGVAWFMTRL